MDTLDGIILGVVQGLTEFLPVSSSGHLIIARELFGITAAHGLAIDALLQLATALAVLIYFRGDIAELCRSVLRMGRRALGKPATAVSDEQRQLMGALVVGTVPAVVAGLFLEEYMETTFRSAELVAWVLIAGSLLFLGAEYANRRYAGAHHPVTVKSGLVVGLFQALALIPGMSRSGATISGGLFMGFAREQAARFGFLLSFPIILGSGLKKVIELGAEGVFASMGVPLLISALCAFGVGLAVIHLLLQYLRRHTLLIFVVYRVGLAAAVLMFMA